MWVIIPYVACTCILTLFLTFILTDVSLGYWFRAVRWDHSFSFVSLTQSNFSLANGVCSGEFFQPHLHVFCPSILLLLSEFSLLCPKVFSEIFVSFSDSSVVDVRLSSILRKVFDTRTSTISSISLSAAVLEFEVCLLLLSSLQVEHFSVLLVGGFPL